MKRLVLVVAVILVGMAPSSGVFAASDAFKGKAAQNRYMIYDPEDECEDPVPGKTCTAVSGSDITWIGDSLSVYAESGFYGGKLITEALPGVDYGDSYDDPDSYIQACKFINDPTPCHAKPTNPPGLEILERIVNDGKLKSVLVFALGTNGGDWGQTYFDKLLSLAGASTKIVLVTSWTNEPSQDFTNNNAFLKSAAENHENVYLADWAAVANASYFSEADKIHPTENGGLKLWVDTVKDALPSGNCSAGLVSEDTNEGMVWNYFVRAGINGVSDNPAAIAGIIGNMRLESSLDPFCWGKGTCTGGNTDYHGIHQELSEDFKNAVDSAGLGQYWGEGKNAPPEAIAEAIEIELNWITKNDERWLGTGWATGIGFVTHLDEVDDKNSPESYAELFMVAVEGCYPYGSDAILDSRVKKIASGAGWPNDSWQMAKERREFARDTYDRLTQSGSTPSGASTGFTSTEVLSGTNNVKFDATVKEVKKLLLFSLWKSQLEGKENYEDVLSKILDDFDINGDGEKGAASALIKYVEEGENFRYREIYDKFKEDYTEIIKDIKIDSSQMEEAERIIKGGLRPTEEARAETSQYVSGVSSGSSKDSANVCKNDSKKGRGAAKIAEVAALMSWPVQEWQKNADDFDTLRIGQCYDDGDGKWHPYKFDNLTGTEKCTYTPRDLYRNNHTTLGSQNYVDCGTFVGSVLKYLDLLGDYSWGMYGQPGAAKNFFRVRTDEWQELPDGITEADLKPGDIIWDDKNPSNGGKGKHGHIIVYIGEEYGKEYGNIAHASAGTRVGEISTLGSSLSEWAVFRYIGGKLGGGDFGEGPDAIANAAEYLAWPLPTDGSWVSANAMAGKLTEEYSEARDRWFGSNTDATEGNANDVSCARFASLAILESGVDPSFARSPSAASRSNIRWLNGSEIGDGMEGYLANSPNWEKVSNKKLERGDVVISTLPHVWIYLGNGLIAEGAADSGNVVNGVKMNRSGAIIKASPESGSYPFNSTYTVYRLKE